LVSVEKDRERIANNPLAIFIDLADLIAGQRLGRWRCRQRRPRA
jgi:hypothetical protein